MRIEVAPQAAHLRDIYVNKPGRNGGPIEILRPITEKPLLFGKNCIRSFRSTSTVGIFRSLGVTISPANSSLSSNATCGIGRRRNSSPGEQRQDNGFMQFDCWEKKILTASALPHGRSG